MSSVQAAAERALAERLPDFAEGGAIYTDTPAPTGRGRTFSPERCGGLSCGCGLPSSRSPDELVRFLLAQTTPTRSRRASVRPSPVHHLLTLDIARVFRRP